MMSILGISLMVGGMAIYSKLNGGFNNEPLFKENNTTDNNTDVYKLTYDYLINMSYEEIYAYIDYNDILRRYKDAIYNDCDMKDKHQICKYIASIARVEYRPFNNKFTNY